MKIPVCTILFLLMTALFIQAVEPIVYPANKQTPEQQSTDQLECREWAIGQAGYDPNMTAVNQSSSTVQNESGQQKDRIVLRSTAKGAAVGGLGGSVGGEFGKGVAAGAAVGLVGGALQKKRQEKGKQQQTPVADSANRELEDRYYRAYSVCLEARGYMLK